MDAKIERRYQTFLTRLQYSFSSSVSIPVFYFSDCLNLGSAFALSKKGHRCIVKNRIIPSAVRLFGFSEEEIVFLFRLPKVSKRRKLKCLIYSKNYRKRKGALSHDKRRRFNLEQYKQIIKLREKGFSRTEIANELNVPFNRIRYLLHNFRDV